LKVVQETTDWKYQNHVYFVDDTRAKMFAYLQAGTVNVKEFKVPITFRTTGRKFKEVPNSWRFAPKGADVELGRSWKVAGSKGSEYTVTDYLGQLSCSCPGFKFRSECKHTEVTL
jgi:hypothetical protein